MHGLFALSPPWLGAPNSFHAVLFGDHMGLNDVITFLTPDEVIVGVQLSTLVVLQSTQSAGTFSTLVLRHSVVLVLGYSYSVVLSSTQLKP